MSIRSLVLIVSGGLALASLPMLSCSGDTDTGGFGGATTGTATGAGTSSGTAAGTTSGTNTGSGGGGQGGNAQGGNAQGGNNCAGGCDIGMECCGSTCVNLNNDILNCGACAADCDGANPFCGLGQGGQGGHEPICTTQPCTPHTICAGNTECCGAECCQMNEICCVVPGPVGDSIQCVNPSQHGGTCPMGCYGCVCAAPDTPIATPDGERAIASLQVGDRVYSVNRDAIVAVPIMRINRTQVSDHEVVRVGLGNGSVLEISAGHPTADGRSFADLRVGARLDGQLITSLGTVPYPHAHTYDILPASDTGTYVAGGVLIGSTLK